MVLQRSPVVSCKLQVTVEPSRKVKSFQLFADKLLSLCIYMRQLQWTSALCSFPENKILDLVPVEGMADDIVAKMILFAFQKLGNLLVPSIFSFSHTGFQSLHSQGNARTWDCK